jgi:membrane peptidoglycan carboxypeptidase
VWADAAAAAFARGTRLIRAAGPPWSRRVTVLLLTCAVLMGATSTGLVVFTISALYHVYFNRENVPDLGPFTRFAFPSIGHVYDTNGQPLIELAREYRHITQYADIPQVVREAVLATEDKRFFSHNGVDYFSIPRVIGKVRVGAWGTRLATGGRRDNMPGRAIFPQGGSTITQQLVRGVFLQRRTSQENSYQLRSPAILPRALSLVIGARNVNMVLRKREELRLSLWVEQQMREQFGSKRRAKEEIFARYASFVYMGNGQYGFARAAEYYFGRPLTTFTADDADKAALLAGIPKSPRDYAPNAKDAGPILRRRNETLALMAAQGFISRDQMTAAEQRPLTAVVEHTSQPFQSSAVVDHVLDELKALHADLSIEDLLQGHIQVYSTVDTRVQRIASDALERGLERYEQRHASARGVVQGSIVVLKNRDGSILAETGGRQVFRGRATSYSDFNRVRHRYATTALGASEISLLELATAYRTMASGVVAQPYVIRQIVRDSGEVEGHNEHDSKPIAMAGGALSLIQEGLRGVVRIPTGTAHGLDSRRFPIAVMGKTGTTNEFRDALFVGSTYGVGGITVAVRIGFDDNRSLGPKETGGRVALPVFQELMLKVYRDGIVGPVPAFPDQMEQRITRYLQAGTPALVVDAATSVAMTGASRGPASPAEWQWLLHRATVFGPPATTKPLLGPLNPIRDQ